MASIRNLQRLSQSQKTIQEDKFTEDGGIILGLGWVKYFDDSTKHYFYVHEQFGTQWEMPNELIDQTPEIDDDDVSQISGDDEVGGGGGGGASSFNMKQKKRGLQQQSSAMMLFQEIDQSEIEALEQDSNEVSISNRSSYRDDEDRSDYSGSQYTPSQSQLDEDERREEEDDQTDDSDDDDVIERGRRLGGGFRNIRPPTPPPPVEVEESGIVLSASTAAMMSKLQGSRAAANGDVMSNQAAFNAQGMLMLESIQKKGDPNLEQDADPEVMAKLEAERVRFQEEMEKVRESFSDKELFRLREEFNDVDADRSGYIDDDELKILLTLLNDSKVPSEDEVRRVMATADQSGDGQLDFLEFLALVKTLKEEKKANSSLVKSVGKFLDTVKTDLLGGIIKDVDDYKNRAYRYFNADKIAKQEKREAERARIKAEAQAKKEQELEDLRILEEEEALIEEKIQARDEFTGLETEILFDGNDIDYPDETDIVTIHIKMLIYNPDQDPANYEIIENSRKRRQPFKFKCDGGAVITGLAISIPKMSLGMKTRILCPPQFAYGEKGLPPKVPPNTTLLIEVELLSFETIEADDDLVGEIDMNT